MAKPPWRCRTTATHMSLTWSATTGQTCADNAAFVVDARRLAAKRVDRQIGVLLEVIRCEIRRNDIKVVVECAGAVLDLEEFVTRMRVRIRGTIDHFGTVHGQATRVFG